MRWVVALAFVFAFPALAQNVDLVPVPFVGCPADGQQGPMDAPAMIGKALLLPNGLASRLAYYRAHELSALAPRGWHCVELYGSNGSILLVTPERHEPRDLLGSRGLSGSFVIVDFSFASTSGRFRVAEVAGPLFPVARKFVDGVKREPDVTLDFVSIANDKLTRRSPTVVEFVTPANKDGLGIDGWVKKTALPIGGVALLRSDMDLVMVRTRLPAELRDLAPAIIAHKIQAK